LKTGLKKLSVLALALSIAFSGATSIAGTAGASSADLPLAHGPQGNAGTHTAQSAIISPALDTASPGNVSVIVQLDVSPAASAADERTAAAIAAEQKAVLDEAASAGIPLSVHTRFQNALNGFAVSLPANRIPQLASISGVASIYPNAVLYTLADSEAFDSSAAVPSSFYDDNAPLKQTGADWAQAKKYTGKGLKVGIVDTAVDIHHPDIAAAFKGGYDCVNQDTDPTDNPGTHGTHVAGIIVGRGTNPDGPIKHTGVAPDAKLYVYKAFYLQNPADPDSYVATSGMIIDGIEHAIQDRVDVLNLSLGGSMEQDLNSPEVVAINNAVRHGITVVTAAGNSGLPGTLGSLAVAQLGIAVGSSTLASNVYSGSLAPQLVPDAADSSVASVTYSTYGFQVLAEGSYPLEFKKLLNGQPQQDIVYVGLGREEDYKQDVSGKIVLISRGDLPFETKVKIAKAHHALAIVHFNNFPYSQRGTVNLNPPLPTNYDGFSQVYLEDSPQYIPVFDLQGTAGRTLARALTENPAMHLTLTFDPGLSAFPLAADQLSRASSQGPNVDSALSIKPDMIAPGQTILSTIPASPGSSSYADAYDRQSGTSMAAAHVSGLALLVKQAHREYTPFDIRAALANTAYDTGAAHNAQGSGRVYVRDAIETPALLTATEPITILDANYLPIAFDNPNVSASFGLVSPGSGPQIRSLKLASHTHKSLDYSARIEWKRGGPQLGVTADLDRTSLHLNGNGTAALSLRLQVNETAPLNSQHEGTVVLSSPGQPDLHLPFIAYVGQKAPVYPWIGIRDLAVTNKLFYPQRTAQNTTNLSFTLAPEYRFVQLVVLVLDRNNNAVGLIDQKAATSAPLGSGPYSYTFTGKCISTTPMGAPILDSNHQPVYTQLPNGYYKFYLAALGLDSANNQYPFTVMTSFKIDNSPEPTR